MASQSRLLRVTYNVPHDFPTSPLLSYFMFYYSLPSFTPHYTAGTLQPQGLCTCYSLCLEYSFPLTHIASSLTVLPLDLHPKIVRSSLTHYLKFLSPHFPLSSLIFLFSGSFPLSYYSFSQTTCFIYLLCFLSIITSTRNISSMKTWNFICFIHCFKIVFRF